MPQSAITLYLTKLEKHQALLRLFLGEATKLPYLDEEDGRAWSRDIEDKLHDGKAPAKVVPLGMLKMIGIGIQKVNYG